MTSLFDPTASYDHAGKEIPVDLVTPGSQNVSLLEFFAVEDEETALRGRESVAEPPAEFIANERAKHTRAMIDAAREEAAADAREDFEDELTEKIATERARVERVCAEFARDRQRFFAAAEAQVVKLAISIARRVLAREVEADTMHLTAIVRAALARVQDGSATVLRVRETAGWAEMFANENVSVVADERLGAGECVLETEVGRVELGVQVQMDEIERGFGDLLRRSGE